MSIVYGPLGSQWFLMTGVLKSNDATRFTAVRYLDETSEEIYRWMPSYSFPSPIAELDPTHMIGKVGTFTEGSTPTVTIEAGYLDFDLNPVSLGKFWGIDSSGFMTVQTDPEAFELSSDPVIPHTELYSSIKYTLGPPSMTVESWYYGSETQTTFTSIIPSYPNVYVQLYFLFIPITMTKNTKGVCTSVPTHEALGLWEAIADGNTLQKNCFGPLGSNSFNCLFSGTKPCNNGFGFGYSDTCGGYNFGGCDTNKDPLRTMCIELDTTHKFVCVNPNYTPTTTTVESSQQKHETIWIFVIIGLVFLMVLVGLGYLHK